MSRPAGPSHKRSLYVLLGTLVSFILGLELYSGLMASGGLPSLHHDGGLAGMMVAGGEVFMEQQLVVARTDESTTREMSSSSSSSSSEAVPVVVAETAAAPAVEDDAPPKPNLETQCLTQDWVLQHKKLQDDMLAGRRPKRFLVYRPDCGYCGMCNRLNGMLGSYFAAVLTDRAFVIDWKYVGKHGWQENTHYLDPRLVDWTAQSAVGEETFDWPEEKTWVLRGWGDDDKLAERLKTPEFLTEMEAYETIVFYFIWESPTASLMLNPQAKERAVARGIMAQDTVWDEAWNEAFKGCAVRALFQPSPTLQEFYCKMLGGQAPPGVGIHVRTGDDRTWNEAFKDPTDEHYRFARCAQGMRQARLQNYTEAGWDALAAAAAASGGRRLDVDRWHLASDYQGVVDDVRVKFPGRIASMDSFEDEEMKKTGDIRVHSANTGHQQFTLGPLLDLVHLSSALAVVGTCRSSFSAAAGYFGLLPPQFMLLKRTNFEQRYFHSTDCPEMPEQDAAEAFCQDLVASHPALVAEVLRTPPFISCPAAGAAVES